MASAYPNDTNLLSKPYYLNTLVLEFLDTEGERDLRKLQKQAYNALESRFFYTEANEDCEEGSIYVKYLENGRSYYRPLDVVVRQFSHVRIDWSLKGQKLCLVTLWAAEVRRLRDRERRENGDYSVGSGRRGTRPHGHGKKTSNPAARRRRLGTVPLLLAGLVFGSVYCFSVMILFFLASVQWSLIVDRNELVS